MFAQDIRDVLLEDETNVFRVRQVDCELRLSLVSRTSMSFTALDGTRAADRLKLPMMCSSGERLKLSYRVSKPDAQAKLGVSRILRLRVRLR